jgi:hydrogenase expression/formation protein HypE
MLGLDPLQVACEGRFAAFIPEREAGRALAILRARPDCAGACAIGKADGGQPAGVLLKSAIGVQRILDMASGEQLPRIC